VKEYLEFTFPGRIISGFGTVKWPPRSPDFSPNDFFLWGYVQNTVYNPHRKLRNLNELRLKIIDALHNVTPDMLSHVRREFYNRLGYCLAQEGGIFEPLIH